MRLCKVTSDTVVIPVLPKIEWFDLVNTLPDTIVNKRYVHLKPRTFQGRQCMTAYDRETDTLFVKDD